MATGRGYRLRKVVASATQRGIDGTIPMGPGDGSAEFERRMCVLFLQYSILWHAVNPDRHTLPTALGWKWTFGSRGRPRSPAHGGKEALIECEAVPLFRPHRTSHLGRGDQGTQSSNSNAQGSSVKALSPLSGAARQPVVISTHNS